MAADVPGPGGMTGRANGLRPGKIREFDHHSAEYAERHLQIYDYLREHCPAARSRAHGGFTVLTRYKDVAAAARRWQDFSSASDPDRHGYDGVAIPPIAVISQLPIELDPPRHDELRSLLAPIFSRDAIQRLRPALTELADRSLSELEATEPADLADGFARRIPAETILGLIGLPPARWRRYLAPITRAAGTPPADLTVDRAADLAGIAGDIAEELDQRGESGQDLLSQLARARDAGAAISDEDIIYTCTLLLFAGVENVAATVGHALVYLDAHPEIRLRLRAKPAQLTAAREEFIRYFSPAQLLARTVTRDLTIAGENLAPGERVLLSWASANHDPAAFDHPGQIIIDRLPSRHLAFGIGRHYCLGAHLARLEIDVMLAAILDNYPHFRIDRTRTRRFASIGMVNGLDSLYGHLK